MKLQKLLSKLRQCVQDYRLISPGDRIAVGLSGGKDSLTLLTLLKEYQRFSPAPFGLCAVTVDLGFSSADPAQLEALKQYCDRLEVESHIVPSQIGEVVFDIRRESNPCSLCAKMRRGALNEKAVELGCNKVALGHHRDDLIETFLLSMIYEGRLSTFSPKTRLSRTGITQIRPMLYLEEHEIRAFSRDFPVLTNCCPANHETRREYMKRLLNGLNAEIPIAKDRIFGALTSPDRYQLFDRFQRECLSDAPSEEP